MHSDNGGDAPKAEKGHRSSHGCVERMFERHFPNGYRLLKLMHMEHVLHLTDKLRAMLMLSCLISLVFICTWVSDIVNLSCFRKTPWTEHGLARWTCLYQAVGCVIFLWMFKNSLIALCNYDDRTEEIRLRKKQILQETRKNAEDALKRAQQKANDLCDMMATMLASDIRCLVTKMKTILQEAATKYGDHDVYERLVVAMASHLHDLRSPALQQFSRLIGICQSENQFLLDQLAEGQKQSMIGLLIPERHEGAPLIGRAGTMHDDDDIQDAFSRIVPKVSMSKKSWCSCCSYCFGVVARRNNAPKIVLSKEDETAIERKYKLKPGDPVESVVLCPVHMLLAWLAKAKPIAPSEEEDDDLPKPSMRRRFIWGIVFCLAYAAFYAFTVKELATLIGEGGCEDNELSCGGAMVTKSFGIVAMIIYVCSMIGVIRQIDKVDSVLQAEQDIKDMQDFKHAIDKLNSYIPDDFATFDGPASGDGHGAQVTLLAEIAGRLRICKALVDEHVDSGYGQGVEICKYQDLLGRLTDRHEVVAKKEESIASRSIVDAV